MADETKHKKRSHGTIPRKEADIISIVKNVTTVWEKHPEFTLVWIKPADLKEATALFEASFTVRNETKGSRVGITKELKAVNTEINQSVGYVKGYIADLYSVKDAPSYYPQFGMVKVNKVYRMPSDNDKRLHALEQMVKAIEQHGLDSRKYGGQYWKTIYTRFTEAKMQAVSSDSTSAEHVNIKAGKKITIRKALNSMVLLIKANYPDTWKEELRVWGFQKEKY